MLSPIYVETLDRKYQWNLDIVIPPVDSILDPLNALFKMIGQSYSFSFPSRGLPTGISPFVMTKYEESASRAYSSSWQSRADLLKKAGELMILSEDYVAEAYAALSRLIHQLPEHQGNPQHQRIVYWYAL